MRRVVLPPVDAPRETPAVRPSSPTGQVATPAAGQQLWTPAGAGFDASRTPTPAARPAGTAPSPSGVPGFTPGGVYQPVSSPAPRTPGTSAGGGANGATGGAQVAFVPAGQAPAIGQPFGTVALPNRDAAATAVQSYGMAPAGPAFAPAGPTMPSPAPTAFTPAPAPTPAPAAPATPSADPEAAPRWGSLGWKPASGPQAAPVAHEPEVDDEHEEESARHPYTWLHMIVLVVVAFILGMLIFMVIMQDDSPGTGAAKPQGAGVLEVVDDGPGA